MYNSSRVILEELIVTQLVTNSTLFWDMKSPQEPPLDLISIHLESFPYLHVPFLGDPLLVSPSHVFHALHIHFLFPTHATCPYVSSSM